MALTDTPTPRSQPQILGEMLDGVTSRIGIRRLKVGNPILSILEAVSLSTATSTADAFRTLKSKDIDNTTGIALQRIGNDEKIPQLGPIAATTSVTISDTSFVKTSSNIYHGSPAPIVGSETINVDKTTTFNDAPSTGTIYIGRGTPRSEGPINYSAKTDNTNHWTLTLSTPIASFHNQGEEVVLGQGGDRTINNGQTVSTPAGALSNPVQYSVIVGGVIPDGEVELKDVIVRCTVSGTQGNVPENTITSFNGAAPFGGASVTNPNRVTSGRDTETTQEYRDRIKKIRNTKAKGTDLAIKTAVINLTAPDEQKTVLSSSLVRRHQKPSILFIDDGNGYEPISSGIGFEVLRDSASGGEIDFKTIYSPICIASVESLNEGPYLIKTGDTLEVEIGGTVQTHIFDTTVFNSSVVATPYDVVDSINANSLVSFKARVSSNSSKVSIFPKDDTIDNVRVVGGTANEALGFPTQKAYTVLLYKNDRLLNTNEYNLDRATGSLALTGELAAEDKLTLGSLWSRGFVESAEIDTFNLAADQALWFVVDGGTEVIDSSRHGVSTLTISVAKSLPSSYHLSIKNSNNFSSYVAAGQSILLYRTENNNLPAALEGTWKIINVPAADTVIIEYPCMNAARKLPATANIANNKILICGGLSSNGSGILKTAEIYDPSTGSWMSAASMAYPRYGHTATTLADGRVLVVGGMGPNGIALDTVEYYTPATDTWTNTNPMTSGKYLHAAILLSNNNVLVAGGLSDLTPWTPTGDSAEFNPSTNHWTNGTTFAVPRYACSLVNLVGGNVFMVGGLTTAPSPYIEDTDSTANTAKFSATLTTNIYNASGHMWSAAASVPEATTRTAYRNYVAQRVDTNKVVAVADNQYYLYNVSGNTWTSSGAIAQSPDFAAGEAIYNGTSSLNETAGGTAFSSLGRSNPLISTANGTIVMPFAEYLNTTGTAYKGHFHLAYSLVDDKWHKVGTVGNVTLSGGKSFWGSTYSPLDADGVIVFGGQQGFDGRSTLVQSFLQESAVSSTVETIITDTNTVSYPSPVTGAFGGVQGWVIYNTSKPVLKTNISTGSYSAATLAENININININGATATTYKNSFVRVKTNNNIGDIISLGPILQGLRNEILETSSPDTRAYVTTTNTELTTPFDFRLYQVGEILGPILRVPSQQIPSTISDPIVVGGYLPLNGTICGLYKKNFWEDSTVYTPYNYLTQNTATDGRELGNLKNDIGQISLSVKENWLVYDSLNTTIPDSSVIATNATTKILPNQGFYCGSPFLFSPLEKLSVTIDNDNYIGRFNVPMSRKIKPADNNYLSLITVTDAENGNLSLSKKFGDTYDFSNFYLAMSARNKLNNILYRFYRKGPEGENYVVRYEYPTVANAAVGVNVDHTWKHAGTNLADHKQKSHINITLPSGAALTGTAINPTSKIAILERNLNTTTRLADLYLVLGFKVTQAERTSIGGTTRLRIEYCSTAITDLAFIQAGDFIRFDAVTPTPTTLQSGQARVVSTTSPVGNIQDIVIAAGALDDGTVAMSTVTDPGVLSLDPGASNKVHFDSTLVNGDFVVLNLPVSSLVSPSDFYLLNQAFKVVDCDTTKLWLKLHVRDLDSGNFNYYNTIQSTNYLSFFKQSSTTETALVTTINGLANSPVSATLIATSGSITQATWESESNWDAGSILSDGYNAVLATITPTEIAPNYQLSLKRPISGNLTSNSDWIKEEVYLIPAYAKDVVKWLNTPCITGLWTLADIETCSSGTSLQIMSKTLGKNSSVQVGGVGANQVAAPVIGSASLVSDVLPTTYPNFIVNIDTANSAGFIGNSTVKITNTSITQKQYTNSNTSSIVVSGISPDGTLLFSGSLPYITTGHITVTGSIERVGSFSVVRLSAPPTSSHVVPGDYIYLNVPQYEESMPWTSLLSSISSNNTGTYRIINISHNNTVIWIENALALTEKAILNVAFIKSNSVVPGDILTISSDNWNSNNKGSWKVLSVGKNTNGEEFTRPLLQLDVSNKPIYPIASPQVMNSLTVQVSDGTPRTFYKKLIGVNPNPTQDGLTELVLCGNNLTTEMDLLLETTAISDTAGSIMSSMNKLDFSTDIKVGNDAYRYNTGLIGEAKRVIYGDESDPATYPGWVSNGASVLVDGPAIKRVQIGFYVRAIGNPNNDLADKIKSTIAGVINSNPAGKNLPISDLVAAGSGVDNVDGITPLFKGDQIKVMASEKTRVLNLNDISIIFVE